jgi:hypothetical protein
METYVQDPTMFDRIQSKLEPLTLELFEKYIERKLDKYDVTPSMLALGVWYVYDTRGFRFVELRSIADQKRAIYYQRKEGKY